MYHDMCYQTLVPGQNVVDIAVEKGIVMTPSVSPSSLLSLHLVEPYPQFGLGPHCIVLEVLVKINILTWQHFEIKSPQQLRNE